jgi:hypothetical protein
MMETTDYATDARTLVEALALRGYPAQAQVNEHGGTRDYVIVWANDTDRHPAHTIWVDADGYTWGHRFEHNRTRLVGPADVAQAVIGTLPQGADDGR